MVASLNKIIISSYSHVVMTWPSLKQTHFIPNRLTAQHTLCQTEHICPQKQHFCAMLLPKHERAFLPISASHLNYLWDLNIIHTRASINIQPVITTTALYVTIRQNSYMFRFFLGPIQGEFLHQPCI